VDLGGIFSGQLLASVLVLASLYALVAIGLNLVYGTMRLLNVAHGELVMLGLRRLLGIHAVGHQPATLGAGGHGDRGCGRRPDICCGHQASVSFRQFTCPR
jgi:Branched-chain amino acid transport system / permease component